MSLHVFTAPTDRDHGSAQRVNRTAGQIAQITPGPDLEPERIGVVRDSDQPDQQGQAQHPYDAIPALVPADALDRLLRRGQEAPFRRVDLIGMRLTPSNGLLECLTRQEQAVGPPFMLPQRRLPLEKTQMGLAPPRVVPADRADETIVRKLVIGGTRTLLGAHQMRVDQPADDTIEPGSPVGFEHDEPANVVARDELLLEPVPDLPLA